jgi:YVTN family beta-propeller protein
MAIVFLSATGAVAQNLHAYVTNYFDNTVSVFDVRHRHVTTIQGFNGPIGLAMTPDGTKVYVANGGATPGTVSVIMTARNRISGTIDVGADPTGVAVSPDGNRVYVTNQNDGTLSVIDTATDTVIATVWTGASPLGVVVTPDNKHAYIAVYPNTVEVLDTTANQVTATISHPALDGPALAAITPDGKTVYVSNQISNTITVISIATNAVIATIPVGQIPLGLAVTADGNQLYVANGADSTVSVIATATNTVTATVSGFDGPEGVIMTPDARNVLVANTASNTVSVLDIASNTISKTILVGQMPVFIGLLTADACAALDSDHDCP